jgi:signal peptidase I
MPLQFLTTLAQEQHPADMREFIDSAARTPLSKVVLWVAIFTVIRIGIYFYMKRTPGHMRFGLYNAAKIFNELLDSVIYAGVFVFMVIRPFGVQAFLIPSGSMWPTLYVNDFIVANKAIYRYTDPKPGDVVVFRPPLTAMFLTPEDIDSDGQVKVDYIKRCQGAPGDTVELRDGVLYRNGTKVNDPNRHYSTSLDHGQTYEELPETEVAQLPMASFKFINWHGKVIPLNYIRNEANATTSGTGGAYECAPDFVISDPRDQQKAIASPAVPLPKGCYLMMGDNRNNSLDGRVWGYITRDEVIGRAEFIWLPLNRLGRTR